MRSFLLLTFTLFGSSVVFAFPFAEPLHVQAPYDSFVCFQSSATECSKLAEKVSASFEVSDPEADKVIATHDGKTVCNTLSANLTSSFDPNRTATVVFHSPIVWYQIREQFAKLQQARQSCQRLADAYDFQSSILAKQDQLSESQRDAQYLASAVENEAIQHANYTVLNCSGTYCHDAVMELLALSGVPKALQPHLNTSGSLTIRDELGQVKGKVTETSEDLRNLIKEQTLKVDYPKQFADAQSLVDAQVQALNRVLFLRNLILRNLDGIRRFDKVYANASWVSQGTNVISYRAR